MVVPEQVAVPVPPARVWQGLRDTDVLRWLGDVGGVQDLVRLRGREYFGSRAWRQLGAAVENITSHSHLSALFGTATRGTEIATASPGRWLLGEDKGVEVRVKLVELVHRTNDTAVELSPANTVASGSVLTELNARQAGLQAQVGVKLPGDITNTPGITGGAQRLWRDGGALGDNGPLVSNGKGSVPMARYAGAAEIEVTFFDGSRESVAEKGVLPFTVDVPLAETRERQVPADHYLTFSEGAGDGKPRFGGDALLLDDVRRTLERDGRLTAPGETPPSAAEQERLQSTVRWGRAAYGREFTTVTPEGLAHVRAVDRLVELAGGTSTGTVALVRELLGTAEGTELMTDGLRRVVDFVARRQEQEEPCTLADLRDWFGLRRPAPPLFAPEQQERSSAPSIPSPAQQAQQAQPKDDFVVSLEEEIVKALNL